MTKKKPQPKNPKPKRDPYKVFLLLQIQQAGGYLGKRADEYLNGDDK